jgi:Ca-activated chloride channel family protein
VEQVFRNPYEEMLEAVYTFPLSGSSVVSDFEMKTGGRTLKAKIEEKSRAQEKYQKALENGNRAALFEKERDDVFTIHVGNLPPGEEVSIRITYTERLPFFTDGTTELRLPLVLGIRYIPGNLLDRPSVGTGTELDTDIVPDASKLTPPRLLKGTDSQVALGIRVEMLLGGRDDGGNLTDIVCSQHATRTSAGKESIIIELADGHERLNRDFILKWRLASKEIRTSYSVFRGLNEKVYGMLTLVPPETPAAKDLAREVIFVIDRSGSMSGSKMANAVRACSHLLSTLGTRDRFDILAFDNSSDWMQERGASLLTCDEAGIEKGNIFLRKIDARGGTEIYGAVVDALERIKMNVREDAAPVIVLLTDGQVGNESQVFGYVQKNAGRTRIFTVGIDTAVNDEFLRRLAALGRGTCSLVSPGEDLEQALCAIAKEIGTPLVSNLCITGIDAGIEKDSLAPGRIPDLFKGRAVSVFLRSGKGGSIKVSGSLPGGRSFSETLSPDYVDSPALMHLWARARIADLEDFYRINYDKRDSIEQEMISLSTEHHILTRFTSFVVVDESEVVNQEGELRQVVQPVEIPHRWEIEAMDCFEPMAHCRALSLSLIEEVGGLISSDECMPDLTKTFSKRRTVDNFARRYNMLSRQSTPTFSKLEGSLKAIEEHRQQSTKTFLDDSIRNISVSREMKARSSEFRQHFEELIKALIEILTLLKSGSVPGQFLIHVLASVRMKLSGHLSGNFESIFKYPYNESIERLRKFLEGPFENMITLLQSQDADKAKIEGQLAEFMAEFFQVEREAARLEFDDLTGQEFQNLSELKKLSEEVFAGTKGRNRAYWKGSI